MSAREVYASDWLGHTFLSLHFSACAIREYIKRIEATKQKGKLSTLRECPQGATVNGFRQDDVEERCVESKSHFDFQYLSESYESYHLTLICHAILGMQSMSPDTFARQSWIPTTLSRSFRTE